MDNEPEIKFEITDIDNESKNSEESKGYKTAVALFDFVEIFSFAVIAVMLIFTFCVRLCRVDGSSMNKTLKDGEMLITSNIFYEPEQGDIVVFHVSNEYYQQPLVKRVIATEGQNVKIDLTLGEVYVDGKLLEEVNTHIDNGGIYDRSYFTAGDLTHDENGHTVFNVTVPEGKLFVMGDNRNHSADSRSASVGFVNKSSVLGKAIVRISPFTAFN